MTERTISAVLVCIGIVLAGCTTVPTPPRQVSAVLPKNTPIYREDPNACQEADALVVAQCTQVEEYSVSGGRSWEIAQWKVIRNERGYWPKDTLSFVFRAREAEVTSEASVSSVPPVYYPGAVMGFCIDTSKSPPDIVAQQVRSRTPSHGTLQRPQYTPGDRTRPQVFQKVLEAAREYLSRTMGWRGELDLTEEYDTFFVVEARNADYSIALRVDKNTYRVTILPDTTMPADSSTLGF